jgi:hypothetical protein
MPIRLILHQNDQSGLKLLTVSVDSLSCQRFHPVENVFGYFEHTWIITNDNEIYSNWKWKIVHKW